MLQFKIPYIFFFCSVISSEDKKVNGCHWVPSEINRYFIQDLAVVMPKPWEVIKNFCDQVKERVFITISNRSSVIHSHVISLFCVAGLGFGQFGVHLVAFTGLI